MDMAAFKVVFGRVIAKQTQVEKISGAWEKLERRKVSLIQRSGIGPNPADTILFDQPDELWPVPASVPEFNRKPEIPWQLQEELAQRMLAVARGQRGRKLDEDDLELWSEWLDRAKKRDQLIRAIA